MKTLIIKFVIFTFTSLVFFTNSYNLTSTAR